MRVQQRGQFRMNAARLLVTTSIGLIAGVVHAQPTVSLTTIATSASPYVPIGTGPALENGVVAFLARTGASGPDLIVSGPIGGPLQVIARQGDPIPGLPGLNYSSLGNPDLSNGAVFFSSNNGNLFRWESGSVTRIYERGGGAALSIPQANSHAVISYVDNNPNFPSGTADVHQTIIGGPTTLLEQCRRRIIGVASAKGDWFVYVPAGGTSVAARRFPGSVRELVTDSADIVPEIGAPFAGYVGTSTDGSRASYIGLTAAGAQQAVCVTPLGLNNAGQVDAVAVSGTPAPGGGNFTSFEQTALGARVVFFKSIIGSQSGIFGHVAGINYQLIRGGGSFQGRTIIDVHTASASADDDSIVFRLRYTDSALPGGFGYALLVGTVNLCDADFNSDGIVDFFDYLDFVDMFANGDPAADFNNDGVIDFFDYLDFVDAFSIGC